MTNNQTIILVIFIVYLLFNAVVGIWYSKRQDKAHNLSSEKNFFIGGRSMNGLILAIAAASFP